MLEDEDVEQHYLDGMPKEARELLTKAISLDIFRDRDASEMVCVLCGTKESEKGWQVAVYEDGKEKIFCKECFMKSLLDGTV